MSSSLLGTEHSEYPQHHWVQVDVFWVCRVWFWLCVPGHWKTWHVRVVVELEIHIHAKSQRCIFPVPCFFENSGVCSLHPDCFLKEMIFFRVSVFIVSFPSRRGQLEGNSSQAKVWRKKSVTVVDPPYNLRPHQDIDARRAAGAFHKECAWLSRTCDTGDHPTRYLGFIQRAATKQKKKTKKKKQPQKSQLREWHCAESAPPACMPKPHQPRQNRGFQAKSLIEELWSVLRGLTQNTSKVAEDMGITLIAPWEFHRLSDISTDELLECQWIAWNNSSVDSPGYPLDGNAFPKWAVCLTKFLTAQIFGPHLKLTRTRRLIFGLCCCKEHELHSDSDMYMHHMCLLSLFSLLFASLIEEPIKIHCRRASWALP